MLYPARVSTEKDGFFTVFIDFTNAFTQGDTLDELKENAQDVLSMAIKHFLDKGEEFPKPSKAAGDDIIWVEPFPEIRQRMGHKKDCDCPVCRNSRGERKRTKKDMYFRLDAALVEQIEDDARKQGIKKTAVIENALREYFRRAS
jgi:predicted RNase H-like HicB family nuclease